MLNVLVAVLLCAAPAAVESVVERGTSTSISTATVAPPGSVDLRALSCRGRDMRVRVTWSASEAARVDGYRVSAHFTDGTSSVLGRSSARSTSAVYTGTVPDGSDSTTLAASVTTLTEYGWTADSERSRWVTC